MDRSDKIGNGFLKIGVDMVTHMVHKACMVVNLINCNKKEQIWTTKFN